MSFKSPFQRRENERELGFGNSINASGQRLMNQDGTSNIRRNGVSPWSRINIYHSLIILSWTRFFLIVVLGYFAMSAVFATIYFLAGPGQLGGFEQTSMMENWLECFYFSTQTFTTVGFGRVHPVGNFASSIAAIEALCGLMSLAVATGLLYGRFSRPTARILFSENALIAPYKGGTAFMFRIANARINQLIEVEASVMISMIYEVDGVPSRRFVTAELELSKINFLSMTWTIVHPITEKSPLYGLGPDDFKSGGLEVIVMMKAVDDTYAQTVNARSSYVFDEVVYGARFIKVTGQADDGKTVVDIPRLGAYERVPLPDFPQVTL